ncbi:hypothetical protein FCH28_18260 [Streptomyces piniterrae]|uniref:ATP-binding protein n=1 Tax=Streptomyces piniterrae TaxID=2571125 RepID=A0A4U0NSA0_9ACTN|nr:hypothetical protein [Streptomyces piniterrae]TJZ53084.1 hypothetical protein FCH28_18260 [Streptomyces piniterrae]
MKQGTIKTLGAVALGAAFAATAAGTASAAPAVDGDATKLVNKVSLDKAGKVAKGVSGVTPGTNDVKLQPKTQGNKLPGNELAPLVGGLPAGNLTNNLPVG